MYLKLGGNSSLKRKVKKEDDLKQRIYESQGFQLICSSRDLKGLSRTNIRTYLKLLII